MRLTLALAILAIILWVGTYLALIPLPAAAIATPLRSWCRHSSVGVFRLGDRLALVDASTPVCESSASRTADRRGSYPLPSSIREPRVDTGVRNDRGPHRVRRGGSEPDDQQ